MNTFIVTAYVKVGGEMFGPFQAGDPVAEVGEWRVLADSAEKAAEKMWVVGNREGEDALGRTWPSDVRSLSVGDVLHVHDILRGRITWFAVQPLGWREIEGREIGLFNLVDLVGSSATSRKAETP